MLFCNTLIDINFLDAYIVSMKTFILLYLIPAFLSLTSCHQIALEDISSMDIKYQFVNLKSATERKKSMDEQLKFAQVNFQALDAVYGKELTKAEIDKLVNDGIYDKATREASLLIPGEVGVYLSTIQKALPNAVDSKNSITVTFEDDVVIPYDIDLQFRQALKAVPDDWDILYLGCYQNYYVRPPDWTIIGPYMPTSIAKAKAYQYPLCASDETHRVYNTPWIQLDGGCVAGMYAYAVRSSSAQKLLKKLVPMKKAVDRALTTLVGEGQIRAYCLKPELVRVNTTVPSTIR